MNSSWKCIFLYVTIKGGQFTKVAGISRGPDDKYILISRTLSLSRNGSVIASFNVSYSFIDSLQIVILQEELAGGMLGNSSAELLKISSNYGKSNEYTI